MCDLGLPCGDEYCPFNSMNRGTEIHQEIEKEIEEEEEDRDRPYESKDPWTHHHEVSPTHMNF